MHGHWAVRVPGTNRQFSAGPHRRTNNYSHSQLHSYGQFEVFAFTCMFWIMKDPVPHKLTLASRYPSKMFMVEPPTFLPWKHCVTKYLWIHMCVYSCIFVYRCTIWSFYQCHKSNHIFLTWPWSSEKLPSKELWLRLLRWLLLSGATGWGTW